MEAMTNNHQSQVKAKDQEIHNLKTKMASQIDQISVTLDDNLNQNRQLSDQVTGLQEEIAGKEVNEKQLMAKIMKLRDQRSQTK